MNLLIAIMSEAYEEVKAHAAARFCHLQLDTHSDEYARKRRQRLGGDAVERVQQPRHKVIKRHRRNLLLRSRDRIDKSVRARHL